MATPGPTDQGAINDLEGEALHIPTDKHETRSVTTPRNVTS